MLRRRSLVVICFLLVSGSNGIDCDAQIFRRNYKKYCKPACSCSSSPCCSRRLGECLCIQDVIYGYEGFYLHYAHYHEDCSFCNIFTPVIHENSAILDPDLCSDCRYNFRCSDRNTNRQDRPFLSTPAPHTDDLKRYVIGSDNLVVEEQDGMIKMGSIAFNARVLFMKSKVRIKNADATISEGWERYGLGLEIDKLTSDESDQFLATDVIKHSYGHKTYNNVYECNIGGMKCFILAAKH